MYQTNSEFINLLDKLAQVSIPAVGHHIGRVQAFDGLILDVSGLNAAVGALCSIDMPHVQVAAEVIGFRMGRSILMCLEGHGEMAPGAKVRVIKNEKHIEVGPQLLGRVIDGNGKPIDMNGPLYCEATWPLQTRPGNPLATGSVREPFDVGIRSINSLITLGRGQRVGIIAGSGVGKSILLGMMTQCSKADIVVVGLVGERAREVTDFITQKITEEIRGKSIIVAVPANHPAVMRIKSAHRATAIAEYFSQQGKNVLLIIDSLTRVAHAQREIGLTLGEQPTAKGYPPSVISLLPQIIERAGVNQRSGGSITALYTILADGDDTISDPVVDTARAILDGHIILSRNLAEQGIYPAIDIAASISRVMNDICDSDHLAAARRFKQLSALYEANRDMIMMGAYQAGSNPDLDTAISAQDAIRTFLSQDVKDSVSLPESVDALISIAS